MSSRCGSEIAAEKDEILYEIFFSRFYLTLRVCILLLGLLFGGVSCCCALRSKETDAICLNQRVGRFSKES